MLAYRWYLVHESDRIASSKLVTKIRTNYFYSESDLPVVLVQSRSQSLSVVGLGAPRVKTTELHWEAFPKGY